MIKRSVYHPKILIATLVLERNAERGYMEVFKEKSLGYVTMVNHM